jgi:hypothetical protein
MPIVSAVVIAGAEKCVVVGDDAVKHRGQTINHRPAQGPVRLDFGDPPVACPDGKNGAKRILVRG